MKPPVPIPHARIESVKQSPMNGQRWCLQLDCGHDEWVTAKSRPTRQSIRCSRCADKARKADR
jgi:hypothetical protein